jgi:ankyrin repeat protein
MDSLKHESHSTIESIESTLIWKQGTGAANTGSVLVILAQNGYTREAHKIIELSRMASLIGRDSDGGLPELWDVMGGIKGKRGITRLMAICITRGSLSPQRAKALIQDHTADVKAKDEYGRTALHFALGAREWYDAWPIVPLNTDLIHVLAEMYPEGLKEKYGGYLLLHSAIEKNAPFDVIKLLIDVYPDAVKEKDRHESLLLHSAIEKNASIDVIKLLIDVYPDGLKEKYGGYLPLHIVCKKNASIDVIKLLIDLYPDALKVKGNRRDIPLHIVCEKNASIDVIKLLIDVYPDAVKEKDAEGSLPLHIACKSDQLSHKSNFEVIRLLYSLYRDGASVTDSFGKVPAHYVYPKSLSLQELPSLPPKP